VRLPWEMLKPASWSTAALACVLVLAACGRTIGQPFDVAATDALTPGESTYEDAVVQLGKANHFKGYGHSVIAHWHYLKDQPGGTDYASVTIMFGRDGRMIRIVDRLESDVGGARVAD